MYKLLVAFVRLLEKQVRVRLEMLLRCFAVKQLFWRLQKKEINVKMLFPGTLSGSRVSRFAPGCCFVEYLFSLSPPSTVDNDPETAQKQPLEPAFEGLFVDLKRYFI